MSRTSLPDIERGALLHTRTISAETPLLHARPEISRELSANYPHIAESLRAEQLYVSRRAFAWHMVVRLGIAALVITVGVLSGPLAGQWRNVLPVALGYAGILLLASIVHRSVPTRAARVVVYATFAADVAAVTVLLVMSSTPAQLHRILIVCAAYVFLAAFYFGRYVGMWTLLLTLAAYLWASMQAATGVPGPRPVIPVLGVNAILFAATGIVLVVVLAHFRNRMKLLQLLCKRAETGDLSGRYNHENETWADDVTLMGRAYSTMREHLLDMIGTDALTGCLNRRSLEERLEREWRRARRHDSSLALLAADLDFFKDINDTRGHMVGDMVLQEVGEIMRVTTRDTDVVARVGGDEFVLLLTDTGWQGAMSFAERLRRNVDEHLFRDGSATFRITISIGVAIARGTDPLSVEQLLQEADRSLYRAKTSGKNKVSA